MNPEASAVFRFGEFRLDAENHRLYRGDERIALPPKAFQLLVLLVRNEGRLLTKEQLIDTLWPNVVVQENNLTQHVSLLRKTLSGSVTIETEPRVGYRFVASPEGDVRMQPPPAVGRWKRPIVIASGLAVVAAIAIMTMRRDALAPAPEIRSLAILPLRPLGANHGTEHLCLGIADAIIHQLAANPSIDVRPTSAVRKYAQGYDLPRAARELSVDAVVEGTLQRHGDRVRIRIQLVDVRRNKPLFSSKFDEQASDLFRIEDLVAGAVAGALALETGDRDRAPHRASREPGAYEAYLKGNYEYSKRTPDSIAASAVHYRDAITRDPLYAAAWAALAQSLNASSMHRLALPSESFPRAKEAAMRALAIDASNADAHVALGTAAFYYDWNWTAAENQLRRAIALDARESSAYHILANLMTATGRSDEALKLMEAAMRREPQSVALVSITAFHLYFARRYDEGVRTARKAIDRDSGFAQAYTNVGMNQLALGHYDEGVEAYERKAELIGMDSHAFADLATGYATHPRGRARAMAMAPRMMELWKKAKVAPLDIARYYAALGDREQTLRWITEMKKQRDPGMVWLGSDPRFDLLRSDARFQALLKEMHFGITNVTSSR